MKKYYLLFLATFLLFGFRNSQKEEVYKSQESAQEIKRSVEGTLITSYELPKIKIKVADEFKFLGRFDFEIIATSNEYPEELIGKPVAAGERLVFAVADQDNSIEKLFIVQF